MSVGVHAVLSTATSARRANELTVSSVVAVFLCGVFAFIDLYATQPLLPLLAVARVSC